MEFRVVASPATCLAALLTVFGSPVSAEPLRAGGTGGATEMLNHLLTMFAPNSDFEVIPSLGSSGGIRAVADGAIDIAVSGRTLKPEEQEKGLSTALIVRTPHVLATSHQHPNGFTRREVASVYLADDAAWEDGTPIRISLRPKSDSENAVMTELYPGMGEALEELHKRSDLPIAATDQDNADWAERIPGSLVSTTFTQMKMEKRDLRLVAIDGVEPTLENFEKGIYGLGKTLYFVISPQPKPATLQFVEFLRSDAGRQALRETGNLPAAQ
jgi:phosphate transport system substrate-binding protein